MGVLTMTMLFIGTIIGAGFATGAEIVTFFGGLGLPLWLIALLVGVAMFALIALSIHCGYTGTHRQHPLLNYAFIGLYFIMFTAMTAGVTQLAGVGGSLLSLIVAGMVVCFGFERLTRFNTLVVISIIIVLFGVCFRSLVIPLDPITTYHAIPQGILWATLYAGLNCMMLPELVAAAAPRYRKRTLYTAGLVTAVIIAVLVYLILKTIVITDTADAALPLLACSHHPATFIVILLAMLTSQYAALFAIVQKVQIALPKTKQKTRTVLLGISGLAFIASFCGFNHIVQWGYPLIGVLVSCFLFFSWLLAWWRRVFRQPVRH